MLVLLLGGQADRPLDVIALCGYKSVQENVEQVLTIFHASSNQPGTRAVVSACSTFTRRKPREPSTGKVHQAVTECPSLHQGRLSAYLGPHGAYGRIVRRPNHGRRTRAADSRWSY